MAEINVTPMVDVMLVLLIIFMVAAPLLTVGVPVNLPQTKANALNSNDQKPLEISITAKGQIFIQETPVDLDTLVPKLEAMSHNNHDIGVYVRGDKSVEYGQFLEVMGAVTSAGFSKVSLLSSPSNGKSTNRPVMITAGAYQASELRQMKQPFIISALFHVAILIFALAGLDFMDKKSLDIPIPVSITMMKQSDMSRTNHDADPTKEQETKEPPKPSRAPEPPKPAQTTAPPPPPPPSPVEQKVETPPPPKLPPPPAPEKPPEKPLPPLEKVQAMQQAFEAPPKLPPLQKPAQVAPPPKPAPVPDKSKKVDQEMDSLLAQLAPSVPKADEISKQKPIASKPQAAARAPISNDMTADEMAAVKRQITSCWSVPAGAANAANMVLTVNAEYNADRTLNYANVDEDQRYAGNPYFRPIADSIMRALRNPACNPLNLPPTKYDDWHRMVITFPLKELFTQ